VTDSQNPFEALGAGGFDMNALLQQAQQMQEQVASAQQELAEATVDGTVGDGLVTVTVNGTGELVGVKIRRDSFDPSEPEDLEDLIVAAYRDAAARAQEMASEKLGPITGALGGEPGASGGSGLPLGF
jgi:nucleoid-associated protein EbfC